MQKTHPKLDISFSSAVGKETSLCSDATISFSSRPSPGCEALAVDQLVWAETGHGPRRNDDPIPIIFAANDDPLTGITREALGQCEVMWRIAHQSACGCLYALRANVGVMALPRAMVTSDLHIVDGGRGLPELPSVTTFLHARNDRTAEKLVGVMKSFLPAVV